MNVISEGLETCVACRRRESVERWRVAAVVVEGIFRIFRVAFRRGICDKPFHVDHDILPTEVLQMIGEPLSICFEICLAHRGAVPVPAVPAHGRPVCKYALPLTALCRGIR